ncbi:MAG: alanine--tRNA ligase [Bacteroidetes bacterium]|nr:alanine--tRNA ligase [Bacteroidota bacterium]MBS1539799.1 alanine--tRNA ligase [Bacteroidota bacterium]
MDCTTIRHKFLSFFESKGHKIVPSAPLVLKNDPTLLFTNSGMVQFKDNFLGHSKPTYSRVADTQKCLRVSGKHNDLEDVGLDTYHHTLFEMLGNWSFGDYFKKEAIEWAWELLTEVYQLPKDRLYVTVFGGDKSDNLPADAEAENLWKQHVSADRILYGIKKDNFWEMGEQGPCGPCSEIHIDLRSEAEIKLKPGKELVNNDHPQVVEIWNLVFMEFNRKADGSLEKLPAQHVDTGMGFERLCMAIQKKTSNYDTDVFRPLMDFIALHANQYKYGTDAKKDIAVRVMADHIRAVAFAIADGQLPSNNGAGYVIRRILRRAVRYGFSYLNFKEPFMYRLVPLLALQLKDVFPELHKQEEYVSRVVHEEEISFLRTLENGLKLFSKEIESHQRQQLMISNTELGKKESYVPKIAGITAFTLYDTFGFPIDLTLLLAKENGALVDIDTPLIGFNSLLQKQKSRSKADAAKETGDWILVGNDKKTEFTGYEKLEGEIEIVKYRKIKQKNKELFQLVFDKTPFYAESGGQVGDTGVIESVNEKIFIVDTKKENELIVHFSEKLPESLSSSFMAKVDKRKRMLTMDNHSATHLLHAALRQVLGKHVEQKGSLVNEKILRFDFSHFAAMTHEELAQVEKIVNEKIRENISLNEQRNVPIEKAKSMGAMALFGEKYGEFVRMITFDPNFSVELCGGTHVSATGQIGLFKVISESSVAAGVRRIEAVTAEGALQFMNESLALLHEIKSLLKNPKDTASSLQNLIEEKHLLEKKLEAVYLQQSNTLKDQLAAKASRQNNYTLIVDKVSVPNADTLKNIAYALRNQFADLLLVLAAEVDGKPQVAVMLGEKLAASNQFHAGNMVKELAKEIDGGGGGQPFFATAGGKNIDGLQKVIEKVKELIR